MLSQSCKNVLEKNSLKRITNLVNKANLKTTMIITKFKLAKSVRDRNESQEDPTRKKEVRKNE